MTQCNHNVHDSCDASVIRGTGGVKPEKQETPTLIVSLIVT